MIIQWVLKPRKSFLSVMPPKVPPLENLCAGPMPMMAIADKFIYSPN